MLLNRNRCLTGFVVLLFSQMALAETMYVQAAKTTLNSEAKMGASKVLELKRGDVLEVLEKKDVWFKVKSGGKEGWISRLFLSPHKPVGEADLNKEVNVSLEKASRKRASSYAVSASARGLNAGNRVREGREAYRADFDELEKVDKYAVDKGKLDAFKTSGKLR